MLINQIWAMIPSRSTILTVVLSSLLGAALAIGLSTWLWSPEGPPPSPVPPHDPHFVKLGRAYLPELGRAYAMAWEDGAKGLETGQSLSVALSGVAKAWGTNRTQLFDQMASLEFRKLVAESKKDTDVTPQERAAMAAAWRGFALGLRK
ncbi:MAG: hypothetical protein ACLQGP_39795 [Isosphaeraceae bacterium]